jgi:hypothetical protein
MVCASARIGRDPTAMYSIQMMVIRVTHFFAVIGAVDF